MKERYHSSTYTKFREFSPKTNGFLGKKHTAESKALISKNNKKKLSQDEIDRRVNLILTSGINTSEYGWVSRMAKVLGMPHQHVRSFMERYTPELFVDQTIHSRKVKLE